MSREGGVVGKGRGGGGKRSPHGRALPKTRAARRARCHAAPLHTSARCPRKVRRSAPRVFGVRGAFFTDSVSTKLSGTDAGDNRDGRHQRKRLDRGKTWRSSARSAR